MNQPYASTTYANALTLGYNLVQVKYGGLACRAEVSRGFGRIYAMNGGANCGDFSLDDGPACTLVGDYYPHLDTKDFVVWDSLAIAEQPTDHVRMETTDVRNYPYRDRFALARERVGEMRNLTGCSLALIDNFRIADVAEMWSSLPRRNTTLKVTGVVYRKTSARWGEPVLVSRWYPEMPGGVP